MMAEGVEHIGKKDVIWSYTATVFTIGAGLFLLPFILHKLPTEVIGIWNIFQIVTSLVALLDFGFQPSFARNISYVFSGATNLEKTGINNTLVTDKINYGLLKGTLQAMKLFYGRIALVVLLVLATLGTAYILYVLRQYNGNHVEVLTAWGLLIVINCLNLYTFYYDALLTGKGKVRNIQQINILGQSIYILCAIMLIYLGLGLVAIVASQLLSIVVKRLLAYRVFFTADMKENIESAESQDPKDLIRAIYPNAIKLGLTSLAGFVVYKSAVLIGSAFLPLTTMASYGITLQLVDILARCGTVYYQTYVPKISQYRLLNNIPELRRIYERSVLLLLCIFIAGGCAIVLLGNWALQLVGSQTLLLPTGLSIGLLVVHLLERNHVVAWGFILAKNEVPFMWPSIISAALTLLLTMCFLYLGFGGWGLILSSGIAQLVYQNWRWPYITIRDLYFKS